MAEPTGWPCIDLTRTRGWEEADRSDDELVDGLAMVKWGHRMGILGEDEAESLAEEAARRPEDAVRVLEEAKRLREAVYGALRAEARGEPQPVRELSLLNQWIAKAGARRRLSASDGGYSWAWTTAEPRALDRILWRVAWSAAELLAGDLADRLRLCDADDCGWLFIDRSRNRSRRWCDMADCGNRAKVRRYRARHSR